MIAPDLLHIPCAACHPGVAGQAYEGTPQADAVAVSSGLPPDADEQAVGAAGSEPVFAEAAAGDLGVGVKHRQDCPPDSTVVEEADDAVMGLVEPLAPTLPVVLHGHGATLVRFRPLFQPIFLVLDVRAGSQATVIRLAESGRC